MKTRIALLASLSILGLSAAPLAHATDAEEIYKTSGCAACHTVDKKRMGPMYKDVAAKYKGQADAADVLFKKIRAGGSGAWGTIPMPPQTADRISDADLKTVVTWILSR
jgi:cytochrome c